MDAGGGQARKLMLVGSDLALKRSYGWHATQKTKMVLSDEMGEVGVTVSLIDLDNLRLQATTISSLINARSRSISSLEILPPHVVFC